MNSISPNEKETLSEVRRHGRQMVRELDVVRAGYMDSGYTLSQCHVLFELSAHPRLTLMELVEHLLIDKSNLSRVVKKLVDVELVKSVRDTADSRKKFFSLTGKGRKALRKVVKLAEDQMGGALNLLSEQEQQTVVAGLRLFASSLRKRRLQEGFQIRLVRKKDNPCVAEIIRSVMTEFEAVGEGYSINDPEVDDIYSNYNGKRQCYFVIEDPEGAVVGGGGVAQLRGGNKRTCELRKMFFLPQARGIGMGSRLLKLLLNRAREFEYRHCYLETLKRMESAVGLYLSHGFKPLDCSMGATGHDSCDCYYFLDL